LFVLAWRQLRSVFRFSPRPARSSSRQPRRPLYRPLIETLEARLVPAFNWTGAEDTSWINPDNWETAQIPAAGDSVSIPTVVNAPVLQGDVTIGDLSGAGNIALGTFTLTVGGSNANTTFSGTLINGTLVKTGTGTLTLAGNASNTGLGVSVDAGTLVLAKSGGAQAVGSGGLVVHAGATARLANSLAPSQDIAVPPLFPSEVMVGLNVAGSVLYLETTLTSYTSPLAGSSFTASGFLWSSLGVTGLSASLFATDPRDATQAVFTSGAGAFGSDLSTWQRPEIGGQVVTSVDVGVPKPTGLAMDESGAVYLSRIDSPLIDTDEPRIDKYNSIPTAGGQTPDLTIGAGVLHHPDALAIGPDGLLYVLDTGANAIFCFETDGDFVRTFNLVNPAETTALTLDDDGRLYTANNAGGGDIYDSETGAHLGTLADTNDVGFNPGGHASLTVAGDFLYYSTGTGQAVHVYDLSAPQFSDLIDDNASVTVASGGTLDLQGWSETIGDLAGAGSVTTGTGKLTATGAVSPGDDGVGALQVGNTAFTADAGFHVELNGPGQFDQLGVTGTIDLGGATLTGLVGFTPSSGQSFTLIDNDGDDAVVGTFADLPEGSTVELGGQTFTISYEGGTGNDVVLTAPSTEPPINTTGNVKAVVDRRGQLTITGDKLGNGVRVENGAAPGIVIITGLGTTTINGKASVTLTGVKGNATINLNQGDDVLHLGGSAPLRLPRDLKVQLDDGDDRLQAQGLHVAGSTRIASGKGDDTLDLLDSCFARNVRLDLGCQPRGRRYTTPADDDSLTIRSADFARGFDLDTRAGNDRVSIRDSQFSGSSRLDGGPGCDTLDVGLPTGLANNNLFRGKLRVKGWE